ncbi:MAG: MoxR family ATPase [Thiotrichaceae bacterium]
MSNSYYQGQGEQHATSLQLPVINLDSQTEPQGYLATPELAAAVDTAITLGMPLLLTGEPGSGKSSLAKSIAWEVLGGNEIPLHFTIKSDTRANDLFYRFDTVGRFHASNIPDADTAAHHFIHFEAMGRAILQAKPIAAVQQLLKSETQVAKIHTGTQKRSVVLIDEIDKAPRDVPNDILVEIEQLCFDIPELEARVELQPEERNYQPIVIITSNSEKALPEAFLRRCVYHHLQFPPFADDEQAKGQVQGITVNDIVASRLGNRYQGVSPLLDQAISWFKYLRREVHGIERKPSLAELLNWLEYLVLKDPEGKGLNAQTQQLCNSINHLLLKNPKDQQQCKQWLEQWLASNG